MRILGPKNVAGCSGLLDRELKEIYPKNKQDKQKSREEREPHESTLTAEKDFLGCLSNTLASLAHLIEKG